MNAERNIKNNGRPTMECLLTMRGHLSLSREADAGDSWQAVHMIDKIGPTGESSGEAQRGTSQRNNGVIQHRRRLRMNRVVNN